MPPKIILPKHWFVIFATTFDSTDPVVLAKFMCDFDMTLQVIVTSEPLVANITTMARGAIDLRACWCFGRGRIIGLLLDFFPRVGIIRYGRVREVFGVKAVVARVIVLLSTE